MVLAVVFVVFLVKTFTNVSKVSRMSARRPDDDKLPPFYYGLQPPLWLAVLLLPLDLFSVVNFR